MFIMANLIYALAKVLEMILSTLQVLILIRALISWVNPDPFNPIVEFLRRTTEPILAPLRRFLPDAPIDLSPIIAFIIIVFLQNFAVASLKDFSYHMRQSEISNSITPNSSTERY